MKKFDCLKSLQNIRFLFLFLKNENFKMSPWKGRFSFRSLPGVGYVEV